MSKKQAPKTFTFPIVTQVVLSDGQIIDALIGLFDSFSDVPPGNKEFRKAFNICQDESFDGFIERLQVETRVSIFSKYMEQAQATHPYFLSDIGQVVSDDSYDISFANAKARKEFLSWFMTEHGSEFVLAVKDVLEAEKAETGKADADKIKKDIALLESLGYKVTRVK